MNKEQAREYFPTLTDEEKRQVTGSPDPLAAIKKIKLQKLQDEQKSADADIERADSPYSAAASDAAEATVDAIGKLGDKPLNALAQGVGRGATLGFDRQIAGVGNVVANALPNGVDPSFKPSASDAYDEGKKAREAETEAAAADNPLLYGAGNLAGLVGGAVAGPGKLLAKAGAKLGARVAPALAESAPGLLGKAAKAAVSAAPTNAAAGVGYAQPDTMLEALKAVGGNVALGLPFEGGATLVGRAAKAATAPVMRAAGRAMERAGEGADKARIATARAGGGTIAPPRILKEGEFVRADDTLVGPEGNQLESGIPEMARLMESTGISPSNKWFRTAADVQRKAAEVEALAGEKLGAMKAKGDEVLSADKARVVEAKKQKSDALAQVRKEKSDYTAEELKQKIAEINKEMTVPAREFTMPTGKDIAQEYLKKQYTGPVLQSEVAQQANAKLKQLADTARSTPTENTFESLQKQKSLDQDAAFKDANKEVSSSLEARRDATRALVELQEGSFERLGNFLVAKGLPRTPEGLASVLNMTTADLGKLIGGPVPSDFGVLYKKLKPVFQVSKIITDEGARDTSRAAARMPIGLGLASAVGGGAGAAGGGPLGAAAGGAAAGAGYLLTQQYGRTLVANALRYAQQNAARVAVGDIGIAKVLTGPQMQRLKQAAQAGGGALVEQHLQLMQQNPAYKKYTEENAQ